jgi:hypothetical protein
MFGGSPSSLARPVEPQHGPTVDLDRFHVAVDDSRNGLGRYGFNGRSEANPSPVR